jgi:methylglutaconyl-CoA hydratase
MTDLQLTQDPRGVATLTLNRPQLHNAFDDAFAAAMTAQLKALDADANVRCVILRANGKSFSAGADLNWMKRMASYSEQQNLDDARALAQLMRTLNELSKPTIARVHGPAYGGGVGLVACVDIAVGYSEAKFSLSEARLGLVPGVISPYVIAKIGPGYARRYFMTAEVFDAAEAYRIGLLQELVSSEEELDEQIELLVKHLLACSPNAQRENRALIAAVGSQPITPAVIEDTAQRIARLRASPEGKEGIAAFLEKRKPRWKNT